MGRFLNKQQKEWKAMGLCISCGAPLENKLRRFVKCLDCRTAQTERSRPYREMRKYQLAHPDEPIPHKPTPNELWARKKMQMEAEREIARQRMERMLQQCKTCEWGRIEENTLFCPFMQGICQKGVYSRGKKNPDQGQRGENPV